MNKSHSVIHSPIYSTENRASNFFKQIDDFTNIPKHMQTQDIKKIMALANTLKTDLINGNAHMFDDKTQKSAKDLSYLMLNIPDDLIYNAVKKIRLHRTYTNTNLVQHEQEITRLAEQASVKNNCNCIIS